MGPASVHGVLGANTPSADSPLPPVVRFDSKPQALAGAFTAHRETDFGRQRRKAQIRFRTVFISRRGRERAITPAPYRGKSRVLRGDGELGVSAGLRGREMGYRGWSLRLAGR